jgi:hypothetical protein
MWRRISASRSGRNAAILRVNELAERQRRRAPHRNISTLRRVLVAPGVQMHTRPASGPQLDIERRFEDLLEQLPLINGGRRPDAQTSAVVQKHNLVGEFRSQREFVRHDHDGVFILFGQLPQAFQQFHLRADIEMQRRLVEKNQLRLLRQRSRQYHALFFAAGKFTNRTAGEVLGAHLRQSVSRDRDVLRGGEAQRPPVRVAPLQDKIPSTRGIEYGAFLVHHRDALRSSPRVEPVGFLAIQLDAPGKWRDGSRNQPQEGRLPTRVWAQNGDQFALARLKARRSKRECWRVPGARRVREACLFDVEAHRPDALLRFLTAAECLRRSFVRAHRVLILVPLTAGRAEASK